jgi:hypothetical protein
MTAFNHTALCAVKHARHSMMQSKSLPGAGAFPFNAQLCISGSFRVTSRGHLRTTSVNGRKTVANGVGIIVGTTGQLGTVVSSARFKGSN